MNHHFKDCSLSLGLLILRLAYGGMMLVHGYPKLMGFSEMSDKFPDPLGMGSQLSLIAAIGAEVGCSLLLIIGLLTRFVSLPLAFTMIIALFVVHGDDPWDVKEKAALFLAAYVALFFTGAGRFSVDYCLWGKREQADVEAEV